MIKRFNWSAAMIAVLYLVLFLVLHLAVAVPTTLACPFCTAISTTLTEDIAATDFAVIARLTSLPGVANVAGAPPTNSSLAQFTIDQVLKGQSELDWKNTLSVPFFGDAKPGDLFLLLGDCPPAPAPIPAPTPAWSPRTKLNARQHQYIVTLLTLPQAGPERLDFFQKYLEDSDSMLSQDAYDEFARTPYSVVKQLKPFMNRDQLTAWIADPNVTAEHRRLYLTMLGVCGTSADLPLLEQRLRAADAQSKSALDAAIACYLTLRGPAGVALIEELFLQKKEGNFSDNYADVYAAIMALRFHGSEGDIIPRKRVLKAFEYLLDHPQMADLVISDLARWEDWSQLERLVELFKNADPKATWIRIPIVSFARACPRPEAKKFLEEFQKIDPEAVKRSLTFFPSSPNTGE